MSLNSGYFAGVIDGTMKVLRYTLTYGEALGVSVDERYRKREREREREMLDIYE